jgi:polysaccharide pyruvyl transferase WcaK-like protein
MFIELNGAGFKNKGAEIMLLTVVKELSDAIPDASFCMRPTEPYERMLSLGIRPILSVAPRHRRNILKYAAGEVLHRCIPRSFCRRHNVVHPFDVDALVDISGYAFGDKLSLKAIYKLKDHAQSYHAKQKPVILLPQMFGPFEKPGYARAIDEALGFIDLAYAREAASLQHLRKAAGSKSGIKLAPDISIFTEPKAGDGVEIPGNPFCCVVPNDRMLSKGAADWGGDYMRLLSHAIRQILGHGLDVLILVHSTGGGDRKLADELAANASGHTPGKCTVYSNEDPLQLKALIWKSSFLVGSRYHSLVAALSGAVPVVMLGWAHKYGELAGDFGVERFLVNPADAERRLGELIELLLDRGQQETIRKLLVEKKNSMREANRIMWKETVACLTSTS